MTPTACMNDEKRANIALVLADGIIAMPVIRDPPDWWVTLTMDGFSSHVNVDSAHAVFYNRKFRCKGRVRYVSRESGV
jgi:hypothetical protein